MLSYSLSVFAGFAVSMQSQQQTQHEIKHGLYRRDNNNKFGVNELYRNKK